MTEFFDKYFNIKKMVKEKREYKEQMKRLEALPQDYQFVFEKIQKYMWMHAAGDGMDMLRVHFDLIDLFEEGAMSGKHVLDITGEDVASFASELLKNTKTWTQQWPSKLNNDIKKRFKK